MLQPRDGNPAPPLHLPAAASAAGARSAFRTAPGGWVTCTRATPWGLHAAGTDGSCTRCGWTAGWPARNP
jgi:hypothetical protein